MQLVLYPDPILRRRAESLKRIDDDVRKKIGEMFILMYEEHGIGLAAPQVGWSTRVFILNVGGASDQGKERVYINPVILGGSGEIVDEEGCLSLPEIRGNVRRQEKITVRAQDLDGTILEEEVSGLEARVVQHEFDHLDGILFIQRLSTSEQLTLNPMLKNLAKKSAQSSGRSSSGGTVSSPR